MRKWLAALLVIVMILSGCTEKTIYPDGNDDNYIRVNPDGKTNSWYLQRLRTAVKYGFPEVAGIPRKNEFQIFSPELYIYLNYLDQGKETIGKTMYHYQHLRNGTDLRFTRLEADVAIIDQNGNVLRTARAFPLGVQNRSKLVINPDDEIRLGTAIQPDKREAGIRIESVYVTVLPD
ncbi:MAG TPA: hypothetical protein VF260_06125 [Bacilli bacterium]